MSFPLKKPDCGLVIIRSDTADPTKAPVVPPSIGAATPPLNAVATVAPPAAAIAVTPAFFIVVHPKRQAVSPMTTTQLATQPRREQSFHIL